MDEYKYDWVYDTSISVVFEGSTRIRVLRATVRVCHFSRLPCLLHQVVRNHASVTLYAESDRQVERKTCQSKGQEHPEKDSLDRKVAFVLERWRVRVGNLDYVINEV